VSYTRDFVKFENVAFEICERTDGCRHTVTDIHTSLSKYYSPLRGEVITEVDTRVACRFWIDLWPLTLTYNADFKFLASYGHEPYTRKNQGQKSLDQKTDRRTDTKKGRPYSTTELIQVLGSQPTGDVSHKPGSRLPLLSTRPAVTLATLKRAATSFAAWWPEAWWVWAVCLKLLPDSVAAAI